MNRRGFLGAMLAAAMAPAVVKAENIMKIWTPPTDILVPNDHIPIVTIPDNFDGGNFTFESWVMPAGALAWSHIAVVRENGEFKRYVNGEQVIALPRDTDVQIVAPNEKKNLDINGFNGYIQDIRIVKGKAVTIEAKAVADTRNALFVGNEDRLTFNMPKMR